MSKNIKREIINSYETGVEGMHFQISVKNVSRLPWCMNEHSGKSENKINHALTVVGWPRYLDGNMENDAIV